MYTGARLGAQLPLKEAIYKLRDWSHHAKPALTPGNRVYKDKEIEQVNGAALSLDFLSYVW
jgi:hypothetical protein